jgi:predicted metal-binding protein
MEKYVEMAKELGAVNAQILSSGDICFDRRVLLKCLWGCEFHLQNEAMKCCPRGLSFEACRESVNAYQNILLVHSHEATALSRMLLKIERQAFLDGNYFAFVVRACHFCKKCNVMEQKACVAPEKIRPCDSGFGIDMYKTVRQQGLPCVPLASKEETQNRYGLVLIA